MTAETNRPVKDRSVRRRAEDLVRTSEAEPGLPAALSPEETRAMIHELRVHQIELEMQNDELRKTQAALDQARAEYFDLYDLAPVGYCTLTSDGLILKANLQIATLLGSTRAFLTAQPFNRFIHPEDQDLFYLQKKGLIESQSPLACDLRLMTSGGASFWVHLSATTALGPAGLPLLRMTIGDITESKRADLALRKSVSEKEGLLKEIHHRVKNNLQVVSSLLRLEASRSAGTLTHASLTDMQGRISAMALVHETLYRSAIFGQIDLAAYLRLLATHLMRGQSARSQVRLSLDLAPVTIGIDQATPCGLIVNELITNSLKHGFTDLRAGEIRVELHASGGRARLGVSDTGVGLPDELDSRKEKSLGLQLVFDLARQLGGAFEVGPHPTPRFVVAFPLAPPPDAQSSREA